MGTAGQGVMKLGVGWKSSCATDHVDRNMTMQCEDSDKNEQINNAHMDILYMHKLNPSSVSLRTYAFISLLITPPLIASINSSRVNILTLFLSFLLTFHFPSSSLSLIIALHLSFLCLLLHSSFTCPTATSLFSLIQSTRS